MTSNWLCKSEQPIRSQVGKLTQLLTMTTTHKFPPQSDDSVLEDRAVEVSSSTRSTSQQRRSKSEESLLDRIDSSTPAYLHNKGRKNSPLSHSSSMHQHLGGGGGGYDRCSFRSHHNVPQSTSSSSFVKEESPQAVVKSRIPVPVKLCGTADKEDKSGTPETGLTDMYSPAAEANVRSDYHPSSYATSRYSEPHRYTSSYISSYATGAPAGVSSSSSSSSHFGSNHAYSIHDRADYSTPYTAYRPSSAKDYTRYNYYSSVGSAAAEPPDSSSYLVGTAQTSPRWRRRSYDHDSDYLRYQRRTSRPLSDYPATSSSSAAASSALTRSRSRSRVADYDPYRSRVAEGGDSYGSGAGGSAYTRPTSSYLYSLYNEGGGEDVGSGRLRHPRPPEYPPLGSAEVSARTRRYQPADK